MRKRQRTEEPAQAVEPEPPTPAELRRRAEERRQAAAQVVSKADERIRRIADQAREDADRLQSEAAELDQRARDLEIDEQIARDVERLRAALADALGEHQQVVADLEDARQAVATFADRVSEAEEAAEQAQQALDGAVAQGADPAELVRLSADRDAARGVPELVRQQLEAAEARVGQLEQRRARLEDAVRDQWQELESLDGTDGIDRPEHIVGAPPPPPIISAEAFDRMLAQARATLPPEHQDVALSEATRDQLYRMVCELAAAQQIADDVNAVRGTDLGWQHVLAVLASSAASASEPEPERPASALARPFVGHGAQ